MSDQYKQWRNDIFIDRDGYEQTKEGIYQEFKARLLEELLVDSPHLPQFAVLIDAAKHKG